ncbi:MAG: zinc carboxypeptidase, partial [Clostridia bacterium]|nr:zinc carboxypeptidase [Clostridia bacterium]
GSGATNHTSGGMLVTVPGTYPEKKAPAEDMKLLNAIGEVGTKTTGYVHVNIYDTFIVDKDHYSSGAFDDYCYETQGIYAMTLELWNLDARCGVKFRWDNKPWEDPDAENFAKRLAWVKENAPEMFKPWEEFDHPQLGKVEIGGFNFKFTIQNPPAKLLAQECEKITAYMVEWAQAMPRLVIDNVKATDLGGDVWKVEAVVSNAGYLPTYLSQKAKMLKVAKTVKVSIDCADKVIGGEAEADIGDLSSYGLMPTGARFYGNFATLDGPEISKKVTWLLKGNPGSVTVTASTPKGGVAVKTIKL